MSQRPVGVSEAPQPDSKGKRKMSITVQEAIDRACALVEQNHHIPQFVRGDIAGKIRDLANSPPTPAPEPADEPEEEEEATEEASEPEATEEGPV